eukprot:364434-Chlamydomonas_euryale.AAC.9
MGTSMRLLWTSQAHAATDEVPRAALLPEVWAACSRSVYRTGKAQPTYAAHACALGLRQHEDVARAVSAHTRCSANVDTAEATVVTQASGKSCLTLPQDRHGEARLHGTGNRRPVVP